MGIQETPSQGLSDAEQSFTFAKVVTNMLPQDTDAKLVSSIARQCCKRGGLPGGCTCHEEVVRSTAWLAWPQKVLDFLASFIRRLKRRYKPRQLMLNAA